MIASVIFCVLPSCIIFILKITCEIPLLIPYDAVFITAYKSVFKDTINLFIQILHNWNLLVLQSTGCLGLLNIYLFTVLPIKYIFNVLASAYFLNFLTLNSIIIFYCIRILGF